MRLPIALDEWFVQRLELRPEASASELLVSLVHGGLRLRDGYMAVHRRSLEHYVTTGQEDAYRVYRRCLLDSFGAQYVDHLERWLAADGIVALKDASSTLAGRSASPTDGDGSR